MREGLAWQGVKEDRCGFLGWEADRPGEWAILAQGVGFHSTWNGKVERY